MVLVVVVEVDLPQELVALDQAIHTQDHHQEIHPQMDGVMMVEMVIIMAWRHGGAGGTGYAGNDPEPTEKGVGGAGLQLPITFQDPTASYGFPGPSPGGYWFAGGGGGGSFPLLPGGVPGGGVGGPYAGAGDGQGPDPCSWWNNLLWPTVDLAAVAVKHLHLIQMDVMVVMVVLVLLFLLTPLDK